MKTQDERHYTAAEHQTWTRLFQGLEHSRQEQAHPLFGQGIAALGLSAAGVPSLSDVNERLIRLTGWRGVAVEGLEDPVSFFDALSERCFPVGNFIRDADDISYTPAPDVFHDLYGHLPFLADKDYADFCQDFGQRAQRYRGDSEAIKAFETLFWFGVEFPLIETRSGLRIFGGGILSSRGESDYCLSRKPEHVAFDVAKIYRKPYSIDEMQTTFFVLSDPKQLYQSLDILEVLLQSERRLA